MMHYSDMVSAVDEAERVMKNVDWMTAKMAKMICGRLRRLDDGYASHQILRKLKRELSHFNAVTGKWKS